MKRTQIALILIGVLALVGGGTALASKGKSRTHRATTIRAMRGPDGPSDDLQAAATYLGTTAANLLTQLQSGKTLAQIASGTSGKSTAGLVDALAAAEKTEVAAAVKAGKLTQSQADAITANLTQRFTDLVNGVHPGHGFGMRHALGLDAAATYLGTTTDNLLTQLRSGKTLAQIANATSGKSAAGLIAALVADAKQKLGANAPSDLEQRITDFVNGVHPDHPGHGFGLRGPLDAVTNYLGISAQSLMSQLQSGKTLAQIANGTSGKSAAGLIAALVADAKQHFGSNVPPDLQQLITDLVNGVKPAWDAPHPGGGPPGDFHPFGGSSA